MIKSTILLAVSLLGLFAAPLTVKQTPATELPAPTRFAFTGDQDVPPVPSLNVRTLNEVVVSVPARKSVQAAPSKEKVLMCGRLEESQVGGSYRRCEWK